MVTAMAVTMVTAMAITMVIGGVVTLRHEWFSLFWLKSSRRVVMTNATTGDVDS